MKKILSAIFVFGFLALGAQTASALGAPIVYQPHASNITATSAVLNGSVNPNGYSTNAWFTTPASGSQQLFFQNLGSGTSPVTMSSYTMTGLTPNTTYSFGVSATNSYGNSYSALITFTTTSGGNNNPPPSLPSVDLSANSTNLPYGGSTTIYWDTYNATSCTASGGANGWTGPKNPNGGSFNTGALYNSTTYSITCSNASGSDSDSLTINVANQPYNPPAAPSVNLTANPMSVSYGGSSVLSWNSTNATSCVATGAWSGVKPTSGTSNTGALTSTKTYTLTCSGAGGSASDYVTVSVGNQPQQNPTVNLSANPTSVQSGGSSTLSWSSTNATSCNASGGMSGWAGPKATSGTFYASNLTYTSTFSITCSNSSGSATDSVTIYVSQTPPPPSLPTVNLTANPMNVIYGGSSTLSWNSTNAVSCTANGGSNGWAGSKPTSGTFYTGSLNSTLSYSISCSNSSGSTSDSVTVYVDTNNGGNNNLDVITNTATNIDEDSATLRGSVTGDGVATWFEWSEGDNNLDEDTTHQTLGNTNGTNFSYNLTNLDNDTTYYFRAVARDEDGVTDYGVIRSFQTCDSNDDCGDNNNGDDKPEVMTDSATNIQNNSATLNGELEDLGGDDEAEVWFEYGDDKDEVEDGDADDTSREDMDDEDDFSDHISGLRNNTTYYFRAVARNSEGTDYGSIRSFRTGSNVTNNNGCLNGFCAPQAITTLATSIGNNSARLNGLGIINDTAQTNAHFEWGTNTNMNNQTPSGTIGNSGSNPFSASIFGLNSNTTYYYRAVVTNQFGTSYGDIASFRTSGGSNGGGTVAGSSTTIIRNNSSTTLVGGTARPSLIFLSISHNDETIRHGEIVEYVVNYRNISKKNLKDVVLRVVLPKELKFVETSRGYFSETNNTVVVNIGDLYPDEEGSVFVTARVLPTAEVNKITVVTANIAYTIVSDNTQEEAFAYSKNTIDDGLNLGASALFGVGFLPNSLFGWLLLLLIILLILLAARMAYNHGRPQHQTIVMPPQNPPVSNTAGPFYGATPPRDTHY